MYVVSIVCQKYIHMRREGEGGVRAGEGGRG